MNNINYFKKMDKFLSTFNAEEEKKESIIIYKRKKNINTEKKNNTECFHDIVNDTECFHDTVNDFGTNICVKCGCVINYDLVSEYDIYEKSTYKPNTYSRRYNFYHILYRLSIFYYKDKNLTNDIYNKMPTEYPKIKNYLIQNKLNQKNDFYYWKKKNNIDLNIPQEEINLYCNDFAKLRISPKKYLLNKFINHEKYNIFALLFKNHRIYKKRKNLN